MQRTWMIVENAGYVRERRLGEEFSSWSAANAKADKLYGDERDELHVDIAFVDDDGELSYDY